jgi:hypothetical protein
VHAWATFLLKERMVRPSLADVKEIRKKETGLVG